MRITQATLADIDSVAALRHALWPHVPRDELFEEARELIEDQGNNAAVLLAFLPGDPIAAGLAEVALRRDYVNGCDTPLVTFLEGIYVDPDHRRAGVARGLVEAALQWGRKRGSREFASDALLENTASHAFHRAMGFIETERVVYFRMPPAEDAS